MRSAVGLRHLRAFVAVARDASFSRAAEKLLLSQSALTVTVRQFEDHLGVTLFDRTTRRVALTAQGEGLLPVAEQIIRDFDQTLAGVRMAAAQSRGRVVIAVVPSVATRMMPAIVRAFHDSHPDIRITLRDDNGRGVHRQVLERDSAFGICNIWRDSPELEFTPLVSDRFGLVCRRDDPLAVGEGPLSLAQVDQKRLFVMASDTGIYTALQDCPEFVAHCPTPAGEVLVMVTMIEMVRAGLGVTLLPALARPASVETDLVFRPIKDPIIRRQLHLIRRSKETLSPAARRVWDYIRSAVPREVDD